MNFNPFAFFFSLISSQLKLKLHFNFQFRYFCNCKAFLHPLFLSRYILHFNFPSIKPRSRLVSQIEASKFVVKHSFFCFIVQIKKKNKLLFSCFHSFLQIYLKFPFNLILNNTADKTPTKALSKKYSGVILVTVNSIFISTHHRQC